jgi:uncharacterized Ntn-hydrolase superfamily protein
VTYSLVARDEATGELGVAVQSRAFHVGGCAWARPGVGAVATQSFAEEGYGPRGLDLLARGAEPTAALAELLADDERAAFRQVAFLAADGRTAAHTGEACVPDCGDVSRHGVSAQGNMLASLEVWHASADAFEAANGPLGARLLAGLDAAEAAGGDFRGRQAAVLLVVSGDGSEPPWRSIHDLRVDDHPEPLRELRRLYELSDAYRRRRDFGPHTDFAAELEHARAVGMSPEQVAVTEAVVAARMGDLDEAAARLRPFAEADRRWREAFDRYERLGFLPAGVVDRLPGA